MFSKFLFLHITGFIYVRLMEEMQLIAFLDAKNSLNLQNLKLLKLKGIFKWTRGHRNDKNKFLKFSDIFSCRLMLAFFFVYFFWRAIECVGHSSAYVARYDFWGMSEFYVFGLSIIPLSLYPVV